MAIEYNFTLDMDRSKRDNNIAYARTGDVDSITINADLVLNGAAYTPTGTNAFFECITPNGHSIRAAAEKTGSTVSVDVPSAAFQAAGVINVAYFRFESGEADNPTYVESTEPFAIVVREGIGDNIDAGDYIEEWRALADRLEAVVAEVEQKAEQAEAAINEQKTEVDQLKAQAQTAIAGDVTEVEAAAQSAITAINQEKADVAEAAEDVSAAGEQAISQFNTDGTSAINQFNTDAGSKLGEVDDMITEAQGDVDAAITQLENETQNAIDAAHDALDGTTATNLQNAINRTLKLDVADMTEIPDNASLSSFTNVGSYCCKTAAIAATIGDCPVDDSPFNMYVFSSSAAGQVMQLVVPIDLNGKPTAEWHVRFGASSAMDKWSVIGGGADIAAGLGIDVTGDAQKTVALDTTAFYQHHEAADIIQGSTEVTGGGRLKKLTVYGNTRQNLWVNQSGTRNGVTVTSNADGSMTLSGTATDITTLMLSTYALRPGATYTLSVDKAVGSSEKTYFFVCDRTDSGRNDFLNVHSGSASAAVPASPNNIGFGLRVDAGDAVSGTYRVMLNEGSEAEPWCPPGLNGVDELSIVTAGKNFAVGTATQPGSNTVVCFAQANGIHLAPGQYHLSVDINGSVLSGIHVARKSNAERISYAYNTNELSFTIGTSEIVYFEFYRASGLPLEDVANVQLEAGSTATAYEPPNITTTTIDLQGNILASLPDGTRDELRIDGTGAVTLVQRVGVATAPTTAGSWSYEDGMMRAFFALPSAGPTLEVDETGWLLCDKLPVRDGTSAGEASYAIVAKSIAYAKNHAITSTATAATVAGGSTYLYPLVTPQEIDLPDVMLPDLASPSYTVYASSNIPAEIEAEVVKVDYLPPSDVYTKAEVDKKIEDAGGMPDIVPVSKGGTGVTTAAAERNRLGLGNTTGAVPIANGGTGATTAAQARQNIGAGTSNFSGSYDDLTDKPTIPSVPISVANGGTGGTNANTARDNIDAAKASITSTLSSLSSSDEVTGSLSDSVHTKFTLAKLLEWLKDQGIGGSQDRMVAGVIYPYTGSAIPNGFLLCNGAAVSRTAYSKLFEAIGTTYGAGDGSSTFNLPNLKQRMLIGSGDGMANGMTGGSNTHQHEYGVTFGEYYSSIIKPLRTYDYGTSAASDNVVQLGVTPAGTTVNGGTQETSRNPPSLPHEYVAYGNTKEASSLPQYLVVNYIISTGEVDATAKYDGFSIEYPITIENGGTGATTAADARINLDVYSKSETDGKIPKVVYGKGNIPDDAEPGTIYINYSE